MDFTVFPAISDIALARAMFIAVLKC